MYSGKIAVPPGGGGKNVDPMNILDQSVKWKKEK
jgi:hypothetical protein